jgi:hypothetical protein
MSRTIGDCISPPAMGSRGFKSVLVYVTFNIKVVSWMLAFKEQDALYWVLPNYVSTTLGSNL